MALQLLRDLDARVQAASGSLFAQAAIDYRTAADLLAPATILAVTDAPARKPGHTRRRRP